VSLPLSVVGVSHTPIFDTDPYSWLIHSTANTDSSPLNELYLWLFICHKYPGNDDQPF